jgi:diguanylate cyclase (GGDEF)-like protein/PAS domain S-box-containing protein
VGAQLKILLVEDSAEDAALALRLLERDGTRCDAVRVESEAAFRRELAQGEAQIILSDFSMPGFDGLAALAIAREVSPEIPFIFVSGTIGEENAIRALKDGAVDYVLKGNLLRLPSAVERALREAEAQRARRKADEARRRTGRRFRALVENSSDSILLLNPRGALLYATPATERMLGYKLVERLGRPLPEIVHPDDSAAFEKQLEDAVQAGTRSTFQCRFASRDGEWRVLEGVLSNLLDDPAVRAVVVNCRDVTERRRAEERLSRLAQFDTLTGLPNRHLFGDRLERALAQARRYSWQVGVMFIDLDGFKAINDSFGHATGDKVLVHVGQCLNAAVRAGDTVARIGGDEFAVILSVLNSAEDAGIVFEKLARALVQPIEIEGKSIASAASVGIAIFPRDADDGERLLGNADLAMYQAKQQGGNTHRFYLPEMTLSGPRRAA